LDKSAGTHPFDFMAASISLITVLSALIIPQSVFGSVARPAGVCPVATGVGICVEECSSDIDCKAQGKLCCSNGCGHVCTAPINPNAPLPARPCTLMVVPENIEDSAKLIMQVPEPESHSILKGVGILILNYGKDQNAKCCRAQGLLSEARSVKSVEYDGPAPSCPSSEPARAPLLQLEPEPEPPEENLAGGWSKYESLKNDDVAVWKKVVTQIQQHKNVQLGALGTPISVSQQVVAGINYRFQFSDGSTVQVFYQPWTNTLEVTDAKVGSDQA